MQITGKAIIRVDGQQWKTEDGATLDVGGVKRTAKMGGGNVYGYSEETTAPELECKVYHTKDTDATAIGKITSATVMFESDTGDAYVLREAFVLESAKIEAKDGTISVKFSAISCERV